VIRLALALLFLAGIASAAPETSKRPVGRAGSTAEGMVVLAPSGSIVPSERDMAAMVAVDRGRGTSASLRPEIRPRKILKIAQEQDRIRRKGAVCGDPDIQGQEVGRVVGTIKGCGLTDAVRVSSVSGIALSQRSVMDCGTAKALKTWIDEVAKPTLRRKGGGLKAVRVAAHYACRTRNSRSGARISEHGKGRAIDISGVQLQDGSTITVLRGWSKRDTADVMRKLHAGACGPFGTVLGPESDRFHLDHFHFDTARYRSGPYCR
jgi:hypothetical protein